jgi:hypothetical protein
MAGSTRKDNRAGADDGVEDGYLSRGTCIAGCLDGIAGWLNAIADQAWTVEEHPNGHEWLNANDD